MKEVSDGVNSVQMRNEMESSSRRRSKLAPSSAELDCIRYQGQHKSVFEAVRKPEAQAGLFGPVVQVGDQLAGKQRHGGGEDVVH